VAFNWSDAGRIALIGFFGVFIILLILDLSLGIISTLVRKFGSKPTEEKEKEKQ
jgi:Na+-transporting methylmalonyl-CoA/oxaloacetate decarboxylase gamma subunit